MAFRRSLSTRASLVARRFNPSFSYVLHSDDYRHQSSDEDLSPQQVNDFLQRRYFGSSFCKSAEFGTFARDGRNSTISLLPGAGSSFCRSMSTTIGEGSDDIGLMSDMAEVLSDTTMQAVTSPVIAVNEVAIAAADSFLPVKGLQYFIDAVHSFTGFNWWASIAITTLLIRGATLPLLINQLKATSKLTLLRPRLEDIKQQMQDQGMSPMAMAEGQKQMQKLFNEYGVTPFTPMKGLFIQGPLFVSFFLAISNMTEKVPSLKNGGAYWFVDLTTPDSMYIFPVLTALTFWITVECNMQEGMEGNPVAGTMKNVSRGLAVATVPLTMTFPKSIFCYWITSNLFSLAYGLALKAPQIKKLLGVPEMPIAPQSPSPQSAFSLFPALKQAAAAREEPNSSIVEQSRDSDRKISRSSVISQRLRSLEKQVKGRKNKMG